MRTTLPTFHLSVRIWLHHKSRSNQCWSFLLCGDEWLDEPCKALRAGIRITIDLFGHPMLVTQRYFNHRLYNFIRVVIYSFASFPSSNCM